MKTLSAYNQIPEVGSDVVLPMVSAKPKLWLKPTDQMDTWLDSQGFYRKHIARDASSLFRCVSENVFLTQVHHLTVRKHCIQFALNNPEVFKRLTNVPIQEYVDRLYNQREWGNKIDMDIISHIYDVEFYMYKDIKKPVEKVTMNGFSPYIVLSLSYEHHYDSVYSKQHIMNAAICQSIFYEILYKCVFRLEEVDYAVSKMLHDKNARCNADLNMAFFSTGFQMRLEMRDNCRNVKDLLNCGITPFPYKVAKSLDPSIYRNVEYDTWNEQRKGLRHGLISWNNKELQVGSRCIINFTEENDIIQRHGYIQQMSPDKGPVLVFVEELGEKLTVPYEALEVMPSTNSQQEEKDDCQSETSSSEASLNLKNTEDDGKSDTFVSKVTGEDNMGNQAKLCSVHYVHPTSTSIPTTCYACITSQTRAEQTSSLKSTQMFTNSKMAEDTKVTYDTFSSEMSNTNQINSLTMPYQVPVYSVMPPDSSLQPTVVPNLIQAKQSNSRDFADGSSMRIMYGHSVDPYYRYGYTNYPYYVFTPNYVYPTNAEPATQQNTDIPRLNYSPSSYPISAVTNELYYPMTVSNVTNKVEVPLYSTQIYYPSYVKKSAKNVTGTPDCSNVESLYRPPKEPLMCVKEGAPLPPSAPHHTSVQPSVYPLSYPPPLYYHSYDYYNSYPEMQSYDGVASAVYPAPHYVPLNYSEEVYSAGGSVMCPPLLPNHSQQ